MELVFRKIFHLEALLFRISEQFGALNGPTFMVLSGFNPLNCQGNSAVLVLLIMKGLRVTA